MSKSNRGSTLSELVEKRRKSANAITRWVYGEIIAKRVVRGEAGECY